MSFLISNQRDVVLQLQYLFENSRTTPANWGTTPATGTFLQAGFNPRFTYTDQPEGQDIRILGSEGKETRIKIGHAGLLDIRTNIVDSVFLKWFFDAAGGGAATIDDSATFLFSHNVAGTEVFRGLQGCIPLNATLEIPNRAAVEMTAQILVTQPTDEAATLILAGVPAATVQATQPTGPVLTHLSGGDEALVINTVSYRDRGFTVSITRELSALDSSGSVNWLFARAARKIITGSATVFRIDSLNQIGAMAMNEVAATRVLESAVSTITFTKFQIQSHPTEYNTDDSDALMEELAFECTEIAIS